jgi:hypothetical protein
MTQQQTNWIGLQLEGMDETLWVLPGPEDDGRLADLLRREAVTISLAEEDVAGHAQSADVIVDVEGHAMTLHMPTIADAASFRRGLAVGVVTATIVVSGAAAAIQGIAPIAVQQAPAALQRAPHVIAAPEARVAPAAQQRAPHIVAAPEARVVLAEQPTYPQHYLEFLYPAPAAAPVVPAERPIHPQHQDLTSNPAVAPVVQADPGWLKWTGGDGASKENVNPAPGRHPELR